MKWTKAKSLADIPEITDADVRDGQLHGITFQAAHGPVRVARMDYSTLAVLVPAPPATKDAWVVEGACVGVPVREEFGNEYEARTRANELADRGFEVTVAKSAVEVAADSLEGVF